MKKLCVALITISLMLSSLTAPAQAQDRVAEDAAAKSLFTQLNFFEGGEGMHISPGVINLFKLQEFMIRLNSSSKGEKFVTKRYGIQVEKQELVGIFREQYQGMKVGVLGCIACHSGRAAGQFIIGIGNKNIDVGQIGRDALVVEKLWKMATFAKHKSSEYHEVEDSAISFVKVLSDPERTNLTQGLVPTSMIRRWFYRELDQPIPDEMPRAAVKVPHLFGYGEKRKVGQFCDGGGNGNLPGWGIAVELAAGQKSENVRTYEHKLSEVEDQLGKFLPPPYPFAINTVRADAGKKLFGQSCAHCHGNYENDSQGLPIYIAPRLIPWTVVKTDHDRLDDIDEFKKIVRQSPLQDILQPTDARESYFAPRLHAVWARFPYLHNGSVPTVRDLLRAPADRPVLFSLKSAGERERFDETNLGLTDVGELKARRSMRHKRWLYDTTLEGQSNSGHDFSSKLTEDERTDLIEYLKTL